MPRKKLQNLTCGGFKKSICEVKLGKNGNFEQIKKV